jgi:peptide/nickel transport system permease protein
LTDTRADKHVVILAGSVGTGGEVVVEMLRRLGQVAIDADELAQRLTRKGAAAYQQILKHVGDRLLDPEGELDRGRLMQAARTDPTLMLDVRSILYPIVRQSVVDTIRQADGKAVFIKTNNLDAYGLRDLGGLVWLITASEQAQVLNLVREHGWAPPVARQFVRSQGQVGKHAMQADAVLCNDGTRASLWGQLRQALCDLESQGPRVAMGTARPLVQQTWQSPVATTASPARETQPMKAPRVARVEPAWIAQLKHGLGRIAGSLATLLALAFLTSWGLILAEYGRLHVPMQPWQAAGEAVLRTGQYLLAHPQTYYWGKEQVAWFQLVTTTLARSASLLGLSLGAAILLGLPLGILAAAGRKRGFSVVVTVVSVLGSSTPSFMFAMLLWAVNIWVHRSFNLRVLPATGFGWDAHMIMPMLVLAMRPLAQIAQVTQVTLSQELGEDYVRTAYSKGLVWHAVQVRHVLRNALIPILNTLGSSLRFSLASLPVVELFFRWPGVGSMLLDAINVGTAPLVMDLIVSLGLFFLGVNLVIELCFPLIDPRLRAEPTLTRKTDALAFGESLSDLWDMLSGWYRDLRSILVRTTQRSKARQRDQAAHLKQDSLRSNRRSWIIRSLLRNPVLICSSILLVLLIALAVLGPNIAGESSYQVHGVMAIDGKYAAPPFKPSSVFPWGTDYIGRDIRSLVLAGAQKTLSLAFFGMLARLLIGSALGILAGWLRGGWLDRMVTGAMGIWAAFPATLFAMIVIQALGIQQGMWVFVVAICVVGWGEVAQFVRGQVIALKPRLFVESARAAGAREDQILVRHVLPNLANPIIVLAALEMGGILMLLAELGFLNIFMGGGFRAMIAETGSMQAIVAHYSDVPEWGALIANVREYWRTYSWMALYPGIAIFISILAFGLFSEGLRRFLEESAISLSRLFNRYTFMAAIAVAVIVTLVLRSSTPLSVYRTQALAFDEQRVMSDIRILSSPMLQGRETGMPGASLAALYVARRMAEVGIFPAGEHHSYFQRQLKPRLHLVGIPALSLEDSPAGTVKQLAYQDDFIEFARSSQSRGEANARVIGIAYGPNPDTESVKPLDLRDNTARDHVVIVRSADTAKVKSSQVAGVLVIADDENQLKRRDVYPESLPVRGDDPRPYLLISEDVAEALLQSAGSSLRELDAARLSLDPGSFRTTGEGTAVSISVPARELEGASNEAYLNVIGVIPGQGHYMGTEDQIIVVSAYYDGLGMDPKGAIYPGANDNASGVALMLELARLLKQSAYQPEKTVLFVAWAGGERQEGLSVDNILNARAGASDMTVETVVELSGVGYGSGKSIAIGSDSSYRLVGLLQDAAKRYGVPTTTRGRSPHYNLPVQSVFGGRDATTLSISWDGSDDLAHTPQDIVEQIDPAKLQAVGQPTYLTLLVLCKETDY